MGCFGDQGGLGELARLSVDDACIELQHHNDRFGFLEHHRFGWKLRNR